ncbi:hypothetical protein BC2230_20354 [Burkholderia cepacia]
MPWSGWPACWPASRPSHRSVTGSVSDWIEGTLMNAPATRPDLILHNGRFTTLDRANPSLALAMGMLERQVAITRAPQWVRVAGGFTEHPFAGKRLPTIDVARRRRPRHADARRDGGGARLPEPDGRCAFHGARQLLRASRADRGMRARDAARRCEVSGRQRPCHSMTINNKDIQS